jgi:hypothetical protein
VLGCVHDAEQAGIAELPQHVARGEACLLPGERMRLDLAGEKARDLLAQQLVLGRRIDVVHGSAAQRKSEASVQPSAFRSSVR